jgi:hypothetical protein
MHPWGHDATGYGYWINQDCCTASAWDAGQWQFRRLSALSLTTDLIAPVQAVKEVYLADHTSWNNAQPATLVPVISSTYRFGNNTAPWRAWDDEIIGIETANGGGGNVGDSHTIAASSRATRTRRRRFGDASPSRTCLPTGNGWCLRPTGKDALGTDAAGTHVPARTSFSFS